VFELDPDEDELEEEVDEEADESVPVELDLVLDESVLLLVEWDPDRVVRPGVEVVEDELFLPVVDIVNWLITCWSQAITKSREKRDLIERSGLRCGIYDTCDLGQSSVKERVRQRGREWTAP
jgi:hypothetical protein